MLIVKGEQTQQKSMGIRLCKENNQWFQLLMSATTDLIVRLWLPHFWLTTATTWGKQIRPEENSSWQERVISKLNKSIKRAKFILYPKVVSISEWDWQNRILEILIESLVILKLPLFFLWHGAVKPDLTRTSPSSCQKCRIKWLHIIASKFSKLKCLFPPNLALV